MKKIKAKAPKNQSQRIDGPMSKAIAKSGKQYAAKRNKQMFKQSRGR